MYICNFVRLGTGILMIFEYLFGCPGDFSKVILELFEIVEIFFIAFRVKLRSKKTSSELICDH